jgi:hypothetical protein
LVTNELSEKNKDLLREKIKKNRATSQILDLISQKFDSCANENIKIHTIEAEAWENHVDNYLDDVAIHTMAPKTINMSLTKVYIMLHTGKSIGGDAFFDKGNNSYSKMMEL